MTIANVTTAHPHLCILENAAVPKMHASVVWGTIERNSQELRLPVFNLRPPCEEPAYLVQ